MRLSGHLVAFNTLIMYVPWDGAGGRRQSSSTRHSKGWSNKVFLSGTMIKQGLSEG